MLDAAIAIAAFAISAAVLHGSSLADPELRDPDLFAYGLLAIYSAAVVLRQIRPLVAVIVGLVAGLCYAVAKYPVALTPVLLLAIYSAAAALDAKAARRLLVGALVVSVVGTVAGPGPTDVAAPALVAAAWLLGYYVRSRRVYMAELEDKNRALQQARLDLADQAVTQERLRIARELHDVVAHTMSVVAMDAGTGRMVAAEDPAAAQRALATIETATRSALHEMRRLLGVLRGSHGQPPSTLDPMPGLGDLDALVAEVVKSGVTVDVRVEGVRPEVPSSVDLSGYRIVQEALTNVIKHAGPAHAAVTVRYSDNDVTVEIDDDGRGGIGPGGGSMSGGHGLVGMRERVAVHGGHLEAGPCAEGGFRVAACLPIKVGS